MEFEVLGEEGAGVFGVGGGWGFRGELFCKCVLGWGAGGLSG